MNSRDQKMQEYAVAKAMEVDGVRDAMAITFVKMSEKGDIDEVTASEHSELFAAWEVAVQYERGNIRRYNNDLYKCMQAHIGTEEWTPDATPALWKKIGDPTVEFPEWSQPIGAGDAYSTGDKVSHDGRHWVSNCDNNVWEPGVYGWDAAE